MHALGVKVTLLVQSRPLNSIDQDIIDILIASMKMLGIDVRLDSPHRRVIKNWNGTFTVMLENGDAINTSKCLVPFDRLSNLDALTLDKTSITVDKGAIIVDEFQNTSASGVYALGDVTNKSTLISVAVRAGRILAERLFNGRSSLKMNYDSFPTIIFSHPPIGTCGMSAQAAIAKFGD